MKLRIALIILCISLSARLAPALIAIKSPVSLSYASAPRVIVGKILSISPEKFLVEAQVVTMIKGMSIGERVYIQIPEPAALLSRLQPGQPLVIFTSRGNNGTQATIHLGDTWLLAAMKPQSDPVLYRTIMEKEDLKQSFPGRTAAIIRLATQIAQKSDGFIDMFQEKAFHGETRDLGALSLKKVAALATADVNGDGAADIFAVGPDGAQLLLQTPQGFAADAAEAWGLKDVKGTRAVFADVDGDGRVDLLVGNTLYANNGSKFTPAGQLPLPPEEELLTVAIRSMGKKGKPDVLALCRDGRLIVLSNPGEAGKAWTAQPPRALWKSDAGAVVAGAFGNFGEAGECCAMVLHAKQIVRYPISADGTPASDFMRIVGMPMRTYDLKEAGLTNAIITPIDLNLPGRTDLLVVAPTWGVALVNRGFGAFLATPQPVATLRSTEASKLPFELSASTPHAPLRRPDGIDDLLILGQAGHLYQVGNPPAKK